MPSMDDISAYANHSESFILCLDDDRDFLQSLKISLPQKFSDAPNYNIIFMDSPLDTLGLIKELVEDREQIALIMTDQMMPDMKGIEFLKEARKITPNTMRVLLTGHAGMDSAIVAINENVLDKYLTKPVNDFEDLVFTLKRLLNEFHLRNTVDAQERVILSLYQFSNSLNTLHNLDEILEHTVSFAREALDCERISILLLEEGTLQIKAGLGIPEDIVNQVRIPLGENVAGRVFKNREAILVKDIDEISWMQNKINEDYKSFISAPMVSAELRSFDIPLGVINVTNKRDNEPFNDQDVQTLTFIANSVSIAVNNQKSRQMLEKSYFDTITALIMALEARDPYTKGHSVRVMRYAEGIARHLQLEETVIRMIKDAAILHDIGKIGVRDDILLKPGKLTEEEFKEIRKHPEISDSIVRSISSLQEVAVIVRQHHERHDGKGYPDGLKGEQIHIGARIMAVADSYDAMTSNRPYRGALVSEEALDEVRKEAGAQFDSNCVAAFLQFISEADEGRIDPEMTAAEMGPLESFESKTQRHQDNQEGRSS
jgi:putative nucleotidyltransferase with HDIG domain